MKLIVISQNVCSGCRALESFLKNEFEDVEFEYINIDNNPEAIDEYGVMSTPTTILWDTEDNEESMRHVGFSFEKGSDEIIADFIEQLV